MAQNERTVINLGAGPSALPLHVLTEAQAGLLDYGQTGMGVTELSHRSKTFAELLAKAEADLRKVLEVPQNYRVIFMQGGGLTQFGAVPLNMLAWFRLKHKLQPDQEPVCDYLVTGSWSSKAVGEAKRLGARVNVVVDARTASSDKKAFGAVPDASSWTWTEPAKDTLGLEPAYIYYCANETVNGVEITPPQVPAALKDVPLVVDMSSNILSRPIPWTEANFGIIYAGAQKNIGPAGLTIVIVREDLAVDVDAALPYGGARVPSMLSYKILADNKSVYNTPPMFSIYVAGLVFADLLANGGLTAKEQVNIEKAKKVYDVIDSSNGFYIGRVEPGVRSRMNVVFVCKGGEEVDARFVAQAEAKGIKQLKGHRSVGGIRTSLYNAITLPEVEKLVTFMKDFAQREHAKAG